MAADSQKKQKQWYLNAFVMNCVGHVSPGLWRHPSNKSTEYKSLSFWTDLAKLLEKGKIHSLFVADVLGPYDVYKGPANPDPVLPSASQFPVNDPLYLVPAMAAVTKNLVFGVTKSTTYEHPYALARDFSTVDHVTGGRVGFNIVTSYLDSAARNYGLTKQVEHDERYRKADEFMDVVYKLWEGSWRDDAVVKDEKSGIYALPGRVRQIHHKGTYFDVPGPHLCEPSPQRTPLLLQAGTSKAGRHFGAKHGEIIFVGAQTPELLRPDVDAIRALANEFGRDPGHIKLIGDLAIIVAETDEAAWAKHADLLSYGDKEGALGLFGGWTGVDLSQFSDDEDFRFVKLPATQSFVHRFASTTPNGHNLKWTKARLAEYLLLGGPCAKAIGSPQTVVDEMEQWIDKADLDGFNLIHITNPGSYEDIVEFIIPELQRRGHFRKEVEKEGATAREVFLGSSRLPKGHHGQKFNWAAGEEPVSI
ncbi:alkanesulfonate monooxygenase [Fusarium napiforme]|uniref:Alkanesulfonate monooxygenase n=1 Tax=Fusarium napiforme TaxID=42672 RepID=A0A8H5IJ74_9HYPO|nr:alkanesulfonate monooxygenase [Fusarium napiforme]